MKRVAIIGGGVSGLACAHRLAELAKDKKEPLEILLFEAGPHAGGVIQTEARDGFILERGADSFLSEKPWALDLSRRLGLESKIINTEEQNRRVFVARGGKLYSLPEGFYLIAPTDFRALLKTPLFSLSGKLRMISEFWTTPTNSNGDESIGSFIRRRFGQEALERVGQPMVAGIYSGDPERLSLPATMPRFQELEQKYGSVIRGLLAEAKLKKQNLKDIRGPRYSLFLSYKKGMGELTNAITSKLPAGTLKLGYEITKIIREPESSAWKLICKNGESHNVDAVCVALPAPKASTLLRETAPQLSSRLQGIRTLSIAALNLAFKEEAVGRALQGFGFVVPSTERRATLACTFSSNKFSNRAPKGFVLLRAFVGGYAGQDLFERSDEDVVRAVREDLRFYLGITKEPLFWDLARHPGSMVQYEVGHLDRVRSIEEEEKKCPGLFLTGSAYRGTGIPDCVRDAEEKAGEILRYF